MRWHLPFTTLITFIAATLALSPPSAQAYSLVETSDGVPTHWDASSVTWQMDVAGTSQLTLAEAISALEIGLAAWTGVDETSLEVVYGGTTSDPTVGYQQQGSNENIVTFVPSGWSYGHEALAVTLTTWSVPSGRLLDADIIVNTQDYDWAVDGSQHLVDLGAALAHELGHAVGLGHSEILDATMYASMTTGATDKRSLHVDDENGYRFLYNAADVVEPEPDPEPEPEPEPIDQPLPDPGHTDSGSDDPPADDQPDDDPPDDDQPDDDQPTAEPEPTVDEPSSSEPGDQPTDPAAPSAPTPEPELDETPEMPSVPDREPPAPAGGATGFACSTAPGQSGGAPALLGFALVGLVALRRRSRRPGSEDEEEVAS